MKSIYEASSGLEAHMILNLLRSNEVEGRVEGEYLQGGAGELQAMNMVRVMVDEADFERARSIIADWEKTQIDKTTVTRSTRNSSAMIRGLVVGLILGVGVTVWVYHTPVVVDGLDYNGDGKLDEKWIYRNDRLSRVEIDRNLDGEVDSISRYDRKGKLYKLRLDENFDGVRETTLLYDGNGNPYKMESDTNNDGHIDYRVLYRNGVLYRAEIIDPASNSPRKIQAYAMNKLVGSEYDSDGDGNYETVTEYDYYEEIKR